MYATLMTAVLLGQAPQAGTQPPGRDTLPSAQSLDGTWTVVCFEKNGQPIPDAKNMTITIRNNVATCSGDEKNRPKSMRFEFAQNGKIRVTELDTAVGTAAPDASPAGEPKDAKIGHYILTKDFFCVCLKDGQSTGIRPAGGEQPTTRTPADQPVRPAGGTDTQTGTFGTAIPSGKADACVVILKRSDSASPGERRP